MEDNNQLLPLLLRPKEGLQRGTVLPVYCTVEQLCLLVRLVLETIGCRGFLTAQPIDWNVIGERVGLPGAQCEYIIWNFTPKAYRPSLKLIVLPWDPPGSILPPEWEKELELRRANIITRAKTLLNYMERQGMYR